MKNKFINRLNRSKNKFKKLSPQQKRKKILLTSLKIGGGFLVFIIILFLWFSKDLPTISNLDSKVNAPSTQILDRNGKLLYAISGDQKKFPVDFNDIPDNVKEATVSLEDQTFYTNHGINLKSIARSAIVDIASGKKSQGGSTITQQFVKNALLTSNKSFTRKIKEAILAIEVDAIYPKDKILGYYLNEIPYGGRTYGIEAASRTYFGKPAKELTLAQAATLAALPNSPTYYSPYGQHVDDLMDRKNLALDRMVKNKYITQKEAEDAKAEKIEFQPQKDSIIAPHFVFYIQQLIADKYGEAALQTGGLKITTTLDLDAQNLAQKAVDDNVKELNQHGADNAGLIAVDPKTGQILAMVGSEDYFNQDIGGQVNITTSKRQPGSSFKPIVYATAFKDKYNPAYPLFDLTTDFGGGYKPNDYDLKNRGPVSIRTALSNSLNIPAVKMLSLVGINNALKTAKDLGINSLNDPSRYGLSLVLGGGEVQPIEMAGAFSVFANNGQFNKPTGILKVEQNKKILEEYKKPANKQVLDPQISFLISDILSDTEARKMTFGFTQALTIPGHRVGVKTGTTQEFHDAWTVGYTPQISTAVWAGNTNNKAMKSGSDGSVVAAPIWKSFMASYLKDKPNEDFIKPNGIVKTTVDFLSNKKPTSSTPSDQLRSDYFASWSAPKDNDDVHIKFNVNKINGKLATDQTPASLIQEMTCANVHSERPDNPSWEKPVLAWAAANNLICNKPSDQDDSYNDISDSPVITITSPKNNTTVGGIFNITADAQAKYGVKSVTFKIDDQDIATVNNAPYQTSVDTGKYSAGNHTISATVNDNNDVVSKSSNSPVVAFSATAKSLTITSVKANRNGANATISWTTNNLSDSWVEYGATPALGSSSNKDKTLTTDHEVTLTNLNPTITYYYRVNSTDENNNTSSSTISSF
jgi:1A family penicillin-binding protein